MTISHLKIAGESTRFWLNWYDGLAIVTDIQENLKIGSADLLM
jgi:hypothetical protein